MHGPVSEEKNMKYLLPLVLLAALGGCQDETVAGGGAAGTISGLQSPSRVAAVPSN